MIQSSNMDFWRTKKSYIGLGCASSGITFLRPSKIHIGLETIHYLYNDSFGDNTLSITWCDWIHQYSFRLECQPPNFVFQTGKTVETNLKNITVNNFNLEFEVDPLFQKTSASFDEGGTSGLLLNHLCCLDNSSQLVLDSDTVVTGFRLDRRASVEGQKLCSVKGFRGKACLKNMFVWSYATYPRVSANKIFPIGKFFLLHNFFHYFCRFLLGKNGISVECMNRFQWMFRYFPKLLEIFENMNWYQFLFI
jgi:hypothetical protein